MRPLQLLHGKISHPAAVLTFLAGLAFRSWDHFAGAPGTRYVPNGHGWTGGPNVLQLTAFLWLLAGAVAFCCLVSETA